MVYSNLPPGLLMVSLLRATRRFNIAVSFIWNLLVETKVLGLIFSLVMTGYLNLGNDQNNGGQIAVDNLIPYKLNLKAEGKLCKLHLISSA